MTPNRNWEATGPDGVVDALELWFEAGDNIEELLELDSAALADRERVGYRFSVHNGDGDFLVEQQAYLEPRDGRIGWMRVVCSGFRPVAGQAGRQAGSAGEGAGA